MYFTPYTAGFVGGVALPPKRGSTLSSKQATEIYEKYRNSFKQYLQVSTGGNAFVKISPQNLTLVGTATHFLLLQCSKALLIQRAPEKVYNLR